jgi:pimeloyl-ACP methyl ester carboxylesterase
VNIIYLPGNSFNNKEWIEKVKEKFDSFSDGEILNYDHWQNGEKFIDMKKEAEKLAKLVEDKNDYFIFAKSIGSILALKSIYEAKLKPLKMVICGHPYRTLSNSDYLKFLKIPTLFIQNEFDPVYSFAELERTLKENGPNDYKIIKNVGVDTHDYEDLERLAKMVKEFFSDKIAY